MKSFHDAAAGDVTSTFERLRSRLHQTALAEDVESEIERFDHELRRHVRTTEVLLARYEFLFESAPDPYLVTDGDGVITEVNAAARALLRLDTPQLAGRPLADFVASDDHDRYFGWLARVQGGAAEARWDTALYLPDHDRRIPVEIRVADDLDGVGFRWLIRDRRERAAAEDQLVAIAEWEHRVADDLRVEARVNTEFLRSLSHNLRGPIGALIHQSELLTTDSVAPEIRRRSQAAMKDNARTLRHILEALVDIERYALGELELQIVRTPLTDLLALLQQSADDGDVRFDGIDPDLVVAVDREVMRRALVTLMNAVKHEDSACVDVHADKVETTVRVELRAESSPILTDDRIEIRLARTLVELQGGTMDHHPDDNGHRVVVSLPTESASTS